MEEKRGKKGDVIANTHTSECVLMKDMLEKAGQVQTINHCRESQTEGPSVFVHYVCCGGINLFTCCRGSWSIKGQKQNANTKKNNNKIYC